MSFDVFDVFVVRVYVTSLSLLGDRGKRRDRLNVTNH